MGEVRMIKLINILKEIAYEGWIVVEQDFLPGMGSPKKFAQNNHKFIKKLGL